MKAEARIVIIGAGVVGLSAAIHLARLGWRDIVLVDQGPVPSFGGSTTHAPGGLFQTNPTRFMSNVAEEGIQFYKTLSHNGVPAALSHGGLELAQTHARMQEIHRRCAITRSYGLEAEVIGPSECKKLLPHLDQQQILGGLYLPTAGTARCYEMVNAMLELLKQEHADAVEINGGVKVEGLGRERDSKGHPYIVSVSTDHGEIKTDTVLCCAGFWGPTIGQMADQPIPLTAMAHLLAVSADVPNLLEHAKAYGDNEINCPITRAQDHDLYFRAYGNKWGVGSYKHLPQPIQQSAILSPAEAEEMPSLIQWNDDLFAASWHQASRLFPGLGSLADATKKINGIFSFTVDGQSFLGPSPHTRGFWVAEAIWLTHGWGCAKIIAQWLDSGEPQVDCSQADIRRLAPHMSSRDFVYRRSLRQYIEVYDILHPKVLALNCRGLRTSPIHQRHIELGASFVESIGYEKPQFYSSNGDLLDPLRTPERDPFGSAHWSPIETAEALHTRKNGALVDISSFSVIEVKGNDACAFLQKISANNLDIANNQIVFTNWLTQQGTIIADLTIARMAIDEYRVLTGGGAVNRDLGWMQDNAGEYNSLYFSDQSSAYATIGLFGPHALATLQPLCPDKISADSLGYFRHLHTYIDNIPVWLARLSYIGEYGWEIYTRSEYGLALWDILSKQASEHGIRPIGQGAMNILRMEKAMRAYGSELHVDVNPFEVGLGFAVNFKHGDFNGKQAAQQASSQLTEKKLCTIEIEGTCAIGLETVYHADKVIGYVSSADYSGLLNKNLALARIPRAIAEDPNKSQDLQIDYLGGRYLAKVINDIPFDSKGERVRNRYT